MPKPCATSRRARQLATAAGVSPRARATYSSSVGMTTSAHTARPRVPAPRQSGHSGTAARQATRERSVSRPKAAASAVSVWRRNASGIPASPARSAGIAQVGQVSGARRW